MTWRFAKHHKPKMLDIKKRSYKLSVAGLTLIKKEKMKVFKATKKKKLSPQFSSHGFVVSN